MQWNEVVLAYFVIDAVTFGGGAVAWGDAGVGQFFIDQPGNQPTVNTTTTEQFENSSGAVETTLRAVGAGALVAVWNLMVGIIAYLFWPGRCSSRTRRRHASRSSSAACSSWRSSAPRSA